jgi:hypothetical protein
MRVDVSFSIEGREVGYHFEFESQSRVEHLEQNKEMIINAAIGLTKMKCENYFFEPFEKLASIDVHYFDRGEKKEIFKKVKQ